MVTLADTVRQKADELKAKKEKFKTDVDTFTADKPKLADMVAQARAYGTQKRTQLQGIGQDVRTGVNSAVSAVGQAINPLFPPSTAPPPPATAPRVPGTPHPLIAAMQTPEQLAEYVQNYLMQQGWNPQAAQMVAQSLAPGWYQTGQAVRTVGNLYQGAYNAGQQMPNSFNPSTSQRYTTQPVTPVGQPPMPPSLKRALAAQSGQA